MSEKFNLDNSNLPDATILVPVEVKKSSKVNKSKFIKSVGALAIVVSVPGALVALADNSNEESSLRLAPANLNSVPIDTTNTDPTTSSIDPTTSSIVLDSTSTSVLIDTTSTSLTPDSTVPGDTTPGDTTTDPTVTSTTETPTTTTPETTLPPLEGLGVSFYENDADNLIYPGDVVTYTINLDNLDQINKSVDVGVGFSNSFAISQILGIRVNGCQQYENNSGPLHVSINNLVMQPGQNCTIEYDVQVSFPDRTAYSYTQISDRTADKYYQLGSDTLYS